MRASGCACRSRRRPTPPAWRSAPSNCKPASTCDRRRCTVGGARDGGRVGGAEHVVDAESREPRLRRRASTTTPSVVRRECQPGVHRVDAVSVPTTAMSSRRAAHWARGRRPLAQARGPAGRAAAPRAGGRGLQRRRRLGLPRRGRARHARRRPGAGSPPCRRRSPARRSADCRALAAEWGLRWTPVDTDEMERAAYRVNDTDRCFHCKAELMDVVAPIAARRAGGRRARVNVDDLGDHRPGQKAAEERGRRVPARRPPGSRRPTCAPRRASSACAPGTSRRRPASPAASRTARGDGRPAGADRSRRGGVAPTRLRAGPGSPLRRTARIEVDVDELAAVIERRRRSLPRCGRGVPIRHPRPRRVPQRQRRALTAARAGRTSDDSELWSDAYGFPPAGLTLRGRTSQRSVPQTRPRSHHRASAHAAARSARAAAAHATVCSVWTSTGSPSCRRDRSGCWRRHRPARRSVGAS